MTGITISISRGMLLILAITTLIFTACESPAGSEGPQGPHGEVGSVGPAGEDGSVMYAGAGAPTADTGKQGDYYLNTNTGEYYGPKDGDGWGKPIVVLMGKDGKDGADGKSGEDGEDGQDGSQTYSGTGAPDIAMGKVGDYYLDKSSFNLYGPKTDSGWGSPLNIKGADGNANVTRYIFSGYDFSSDDFHRVTIRNLSEAEMKNSAWLVYFLRNSGNTTIYYSIPGKGALREYSMRRNYYNGFILFDISRESASDGAEYDRIEIVRIAASNTVDNAKQSSKIKLPNDLDRTNYQEVANYYGF